MNFLINNMQVKLAGFGILSLFLIMLVPVYAEVTEFSSEKKFYTIDEGIVFVGNTAEGHEEVNVLMINPNGKENLVPGAVSNMQGIFETFPKKIDNILLHKVYGYLIFLSILFVIFQAIFSWSSFPMELIENGFLR